MGEIGSSVDEKHSEEELNPEELLTRLPNEEEEDELSELFTTFTFLGLPMPFLVCRRS